ncbi:hypothetical protein [Photobacterium leiognathi]|uniref:hypothetical protein n=1 Tax=Photobacterium leiognathi TaxID=553611 RepID=UPI0027363A52|nr:hypothetical protein [Photobacterium leiognathi]
MDFDKKFIGKDLVISCNEIVIADYSSNGSVININDYSNVFFNEEFSYLWNSTLEDYCKGIYFHGYISFESEVYRRCVKPIFMWINALEDQISKHDICHIEFNSYINDSEVFVYEAEGEVNKKINYKSYFYIPKIISEYLSKKHPEICLIKKEKSKKRKENLFLFRNIMMFSFLFLSKFLCKIKSGKKSISNVNNNDLLLISTRSQVQSEYMLGLYEKYKNKAVFLCSEQSSKPSSNKNFLKSFNIDFYCTERELSLIKLLKIGFKVLNRYRKIKNPPSLEFKCGVVIPTSNILKEITIREFDFLVYEEG